MVQHRILLHYFEWNLSPPHLLSLLHKGINEVKGFPTLGMGTFAYLSILILLRKGWFTISTLLLDLKRAYLITVDSMQSVPQSD